MCDENLTDLVLDIACQHPRSRLRSWTHRNVGHADTVAILEAMKDEAEQNDVTMAKAGAAMLGFLDAWDDIPRDKWKYARPIPEFFKQGDYRLEPKKLPGIDPQDHRQPWRGDLSSQRLVGQRN